MYNILLVEDNLADAFLVEEALKGYNMRITRIEDGEQAIEHLEKLGYDSSTPLPDLIFLDINLPKKSGKEVLAYIKGHDFLKSIPTLILSGSTSINDINDSYQLHANSYITKSIDIEEFFNNINSIVDYWLNTVKRPVLEIS